jgi:hypothetical protein
VPKRRPQRLKLSHEVTADDRFEKAQEALSRAGVVCFLGFGYAPENMRRLKWEHRIDEGKRKTIFGTLYNLTEAEQGRLAIGRYFNISDKIPPRWDILEFLRNTSVLG